jgi:hypothetical protein
MHEVLKPNPKLEKRSPSIEIPLIELLSNAADGKICIVKVVKE